MRKRTLLPVAVAASLMVPAVAAADAGRGEQLFKRMCQSCHATAAEGRNVPAPRLWGIVGKPAASVEGASYSPALKGSGITWTREALDGYLANPRGAVPGTTMMVGVSGAADRADVIDYLETLK